mmetsp:Transcript_90918/g.185275  ORF Transcript_90918/g.185275 Transcript_90918/m.185275 type:complete len:403 (+) Transcript_90918:135-1343(+)|eukprot:CAMPEP_0201175762 /NCGR_PEP_ID=MMETSP0851-20130426/102785_1 /ASSEMBLY_ACC=CAM_ASM_000631 /TAXON_ID=183588 /ORGANISM="Pseudo-nitzschia fraudulenta, Strain WWA7" /LENGTH=402 /DNA_ID=CAMNT_0047458989 /DNA_START=134 /DNA_END=1342 /DNA_ORIENTATION=-
MGKTRKNNKKKKKSKPLSGATLHNNFVSEAGPGCFIVRRSDGSSKKTKNPDWMIGWEDVDPEDFGIDVNDDSEWIECEVPDIAMDPDEFTLSVCNVHSYTKVAYVTVFETSVRGANGKELAQGSTTNNNGETVACTTFIVLCPPCVFAHLCYLGVSSDEELHNIRIESDVSKWNQHPNPSDEHPYRIGFPLSCNNSLAAGGNAVSFLCTQGEDGELTHFFSGNLHAFDFRCPVGTELLAVADGTIVEANDKNILTGIAVTNLFKWNSILLQIETIEANGDDCTGGKDDRRSEVGGDEPLFVEYVHIMESMVRAGDRVKRGQVIGYSGSVGFSPEPHLHFSAFRSSDAEAPTVRVRFENYNSREREGNNRHDGDPITFLPRAGKWYNRDGIVEKAASTDVDKV